MYKNIINLMINSFKKSSFVKNRKIKKIGKEGEDKVIYNIFNFLTKYRGELLNNVIFQSKRFSTQIDHIIVGNNRNIIVIETKNYKGNITGKKEDVYWYQHLGNNSFKFKNPITQNNGHVKALNNVLKWNNIGNYNIINLVVFTNDCILPKIRNVISINELEDTLKEYLNLSNNNAEDILSVIKNKGFIDSRLALKKHIKYVKKI